jgi:PAS domain S-box-containing protein
MIIEQGRRIGMVNDALLAMQGDTRENIIGQPCYKILHHRDTHCEMPHGECPYDEVFESGKNSRIVHHHLTKQDQDIVVELTASPIKDENGKVTRVFEVMRDVTVEQRLQEENRQSLAFLDGVLEGIGEGVVVMDRGYRILSANKGYLLQVDSEKAAIIGKHCYEVSHHFDSHCMDNGHDCPVKAAFEKGAPARVMHTHYDHHDKPVYVECQAYPIKDSSGAVVRAIETLNDVTDRVLLEQKVKESEGKYRDLYDNAPDGYISLDEDGVIVEVNRTFLDMIGYSRGEIVRRMPFKNLLSSESAQICNIVFPEFKKGGRMRNLELTVIKKDGAPLPVTMNASAVFDADGRLLVCRSVIRDISEKRKMDDEKRKLQQQLFQSQKLEALGTLAGGIAHDFNNLLASIMGYASLAKAELPLDHAVYRHVDIIETASVRASELTQQLLAFAKGGKYDAKPNDVNAIVREVEALLSRTIDKNITLELQTAEGLYQAVCDAGQVQQAVLNICINARDAMPRGGKLTIETENLSLGKEDVKTLVDISPGNYVRISISDTGVGMDRETREHIFDPFFTTKEKGTGLGLSLAYGIVKKHGGFIQTYSEPGRGSTFKVNLPAGRAGKEYPHGEEERDLRQGSELVLVVDDEPMIKTLAQDILQRYGYTVLTAEGGEEAIAIYSRQWKEISLVLLDMVMPKIDGREVFRRVREINPRVKVIVSSGYSHDRDADDLLEQGAAGFVQKPYRMADLLKMVEKVLDRNA